MCSSDLDRNNATNLFSVDLNSGEILQHTDFDPRKMTEYYNFLTATVNPIKDEVYFYLSGSIVALDLKTQEQRVIYQIPKGYIHSMINCTADGKSVCIGLFQDLSAQFSIDYQRGYVGFAQTLRAHPYSMIVQIPLNGTNPDIVWEEKEWIGHINTSPTQPHLLTFCHEGPWTSVDQRIWGLNLETREAWKIRPKQGKEHFGHEYWLADGEHIGYHGGLANGQKIFGFIKYDNTDQREIEFPFQTGHIHSLDMDVIVGDAGRVVRCWVWDKDEGEYVGPLVLCEHNCTMKIQILHVHPRFSPDGKFVLFTSDRKGYGNVHLVEVPEKKKLLDLPFEIIE